MEVTGKLAVGPVSGWAWVVPYRSPPLESRHRSAIRVVLHADFSAVRSAFVLQRQILGLLFLTGSSGNHHGDAVHACFH